MLHPSSVGILEVKSVHHVGYAVMRVTIWAQFMALWLTRNGGWKGGVLSFEAVSLSGASACFRFRKGYIFDKPVVMSRRKVSHLPCRSKPTLFYLLLGQPTNLKLIKVSPYKVNYTAYRVTKSFLLRLWLSGVFSMVGMGSEMLI